MTVSVQWPALLKDDAPLTGSWHRLLGQYVAQELLEYDASSVQGRMKALNKRIDVLTQQLEFLKQIKQERAVHDLRLRPPVTVPAE